MPKKPGRPEHEFSPLAPVEKQFKGQLEFPIQREIVRDRNSEQGGRSFYFFDFDDNVAFLSTPTFLFHKSTGAELRLSSGEFARFHRTVGKSGPFSDYRIDLCDKTGSFRCFRDQDHSELERQLGKRQLFIEDLAAALGMPDVHWKGPSWSCFYHAVLNQRPVSVITARGHHPETIKNGIQLLVDHSHIPQTPNYLSVYPVSHPSVRANLLSSTEESKNISVAHLKQAAIRASVQRAFEVYGQNPFHRFGMSDDDPHNIELIVEEMMRLKAKYPECSFFVIDSQAGHLVKWEVYADRKEAMMCASDKEIDAFEQLPLKIRS